MYHSHQMKLTTTHNRNKKMKQSITLSKIHNGMKILSLATTAGIRELIEDNKQQPAIFIIDDTDFDEMQGTESLIYNVFIGGDDFMNGTLEGFESYDRKCYSFDSAIDYADSLNKKFPKFEYVGMI